MDELSLLTTGGRIFTTARPRKLGLGRRALQVMVATGTLDHVCRGVYGAPQPDLGVEEKHLRVARAGLLLDPALSHVSAVLAHGPPLPTQ